MKQLFAIGLIAVTLLGMLTPARAAERNNYGGIGFARPANLKRHGHAIVFSSGNVVARAEKRVEFLGVRTYERSGLTLSFGYMGGKGRTCGAWAGAGLTGSF